MTSTRFSDDALPVRTATRATQPTMDELRERRDSVEDATSDEIANCIRCGDVPGFDSASCGLHCEGCCDCEDE